MLAKDTRIIISIIIIFVAIFCLWQVVRPWMAEYFYRKGFVENTYRRYEDSIRSLNTANKFAPWETYYMITQVRNYEEMSRQAEGVANKVAWLTKSKDLYELMIKINPTNPWYYSGLAAIYLSLFNFSPTPEERKKFYDLAGDAYKKAASIDNLNPLFQMSLAYYYHRSGKVEEAVKLYEKCTILDDLFVEAYYNLGEIEISKGNYDAAIKRFEQMVSADEQTYDKDTKTYPDWVKGGNFNNYRAKLGELYLAKRDFKQAIYYFKYALEKNQEDARVWRGLGVAYHQSGEIELAIYAYKQALNIDPEMTDVNKYLGYAYYNAGLLNSSMENLRHYSSGNPGDKKAQEDMDKIGVIRSRFPGKQ